MGRLDGKVAVITGGSSGIGKASVRLFVEEGAQVIFGDIQDELGKALAEELGPNAIYHHSNVRNESEIKSLIDLAVEKFGRLDCMFNNAGFPCVGGPIDEIPTDGFDVSMEIQFRSVFLGMKHAVPIMKQQGSGSIISTASVAGLRTGFGSHVYSAAKAAIIHLTRTVAMELGEFNIRVNCICPGGIATAIFGKGLGFNQEKADRFKEVVKMFLSQIQPINRPGLPEDIAKAALWLASDDSTFVSGHPLVVDGGLIGGRMWGQNAEQWEKMVKPLGIDDLEENRRRINEEIAKMK
ncbi:MAG: glucose 1-dehydrogenase [Promethearchaeota archaeon]|jgi:NAD(P)-dependent dehydrogenase (short-subunit alcohol dehydrogenase family)